MNETGSARRLQSERLVLVPLRIADADEMVDVLADPRLYTHTGGCPPDLATLRDRYAWQVRGRSADGSALWFNWIVRTRGSLAAVGYVQVTLGRESGVADMAWVIGSEHQGHGYASEAAGAVLDWLAARLDVRRITAHIAASNLASQKVARRLGFAVSREVEEGETVWEHVRQSSSG